MRIFLATFAFAALLPAQSKPATSCPDLRGLTNNQVSIAIAMSVPESADAPAHCRVAGQILPQVGFEVHMPATWNGRFVMLGNGGFAGWRSTLPPGSTHSGRRTTGNGTDRRRTSGQRGWRITC